MLIHSFIIMCIRSFFLFLVLIIIRTRSLFLFIRFTITRTRLLGTFLFLLFIDVIEDFIDSLTCFLLEMSY